MAPHRSWQWSLAPLGRSKSNDSIVNLLKSNDFGPPRIAVGYGFGPPGSEVLDPLVGTGQSPKVSIENNINRFSTLLWESPLMLDNIALYKSMLDNMTLLII